MVSFCENLEIKSSPLMNRTREALTVILEANIEAVIFLQSKHEQRKVVINPGALIGWKRH